MDESEKTIRRAGWRQAPVPCDDTSVTVPVPTQLPRTRQQDCDTPAPTPAEIFYAPTAQPIDTPVTLLLIPVLVIGNTSQTATCTGAGGAPIGSDVTVGANTFTTEVLLQNIPALTTSQGQLIAGLSDGDLNSLATADQAAIEALCLLGPTQAAWVVSEVSATQTALNNQANASALQQLLCVWQNSSQTATCSGSAVATDVLPGAVNPVVVSAYTFSSAVSQDDANAQALAAATAALVCLWTNVSTTKTCLDAGFGATVPVDSVPVVAGAPLRIGSITLAPGAVISTVNQSEANAQAAALALSELACFYFNTSTTVTCADIGATGTASIAAGNPATGSSGNPVTVPAYMLQSVVSVTDANSQATALATSLLNCFWQNASQTATCPSETISGPTVVPASSTASPVYTVTIPSGTVTSYVSQADANAQALTLAQVQLSCVYCNVAIAAVCPQPVGGTCNSLQETTGVAAGTFCADSAADAQAIAASIAAIPIAAQTSPGASCTYGNIQIVAACVAATGITGAFPSGTTGLSNFTTPPPGQTITIAADAYTISNADVPSDYEVGVPCRTQDYANFLAQQAALSYMNCFWSSTATAYTCDDAKSYNGVLQDTAVADTAPSLTPPIYWRYVDPWTGATCGLDGSGNPALPLPHLVTTDPTNTYGVVVRGGVAYYVGLNDGSAQLPVDGVCPARPVVGTVPMTNSTPLQAVYVSHAPMGYTDGVPFDVGHITRAIVSYDAMAGLAPQAVACVQSAYDAARSYTSLAAANAQAKLLAIAQLICIYTNQSEAIGGPCPWQAPVQIGTSSVGAGTMLSVISASDAQQQAQNLANSLLQCIPEPPSSGITTINSDSPCQSCVTVNIEPQEAIQDGALWALVPDTNSAGGMESNVDDGTATLALSGQTLIQWNVSGAKVCVPSQTSSTGSNTFVNYKIIGKAIPGWQVASDSSALLQEGEQDVSSLSCDGEQTFTATYEPSVYSISSGSLDSSAGTSAIAGTHLCYLQSYMMVNGMLASVYLIATQPQSAS